MLVDDASVRPVWSARDLLLNGEFCPLEAISTALQDFLSTSSASWMVLSAYDRAGILRSLTFTASTDPTLRDELETKVAKAAFTAYTPSQVEGATNLLTATEEAALSYLNGKKRRLFENMPGQTRLVFGAREYAQRQGVSFLLAHDGPTPVKLEAAFEASLAEMLNGSLIANVRRDQRIARSITKAGRRAGEVERGSPLVLEQLIALARDATSSDYAAYYEVDGRTATLRRIATDGTAGAAIPDTVPIESDLALDPLWAPIAHYVRRSAADTATYVHIARALVPFAPFPTFVCIAVPADPVGRAMPNLGVLLLCRFPDHKASSDSAYESRFSSFDLALTRNVALRISLLASISNARRSSKLLTSLTLPTARRDEVPLGRSSVASNRPYEMIPWDVYVAVPELTALLGQLAEVTHASSATMRALCVTRLESRNHFILRRFISFPVERLHDDLRDIALQNTDKGLAEQLSSNAFAAITGEVAHIRDAEPFLDPSNTRVESGVPGPAKLMEVQGRPRIGSTITLPVVVDGMTVATINLESPMKGAFQIHEDTCRVAAALAAIIIGAARSAQVRDLARVAGELGVGPHDAVNAEDKLAKIAAVVPADLRPHVDDLREIVLRKPLKNERAVVPIGRKALKDLVDSEMRGEVEVRVADTHTIPAHLEETFRDILREAYRNLKDHSAAAYSHLRHVRDTTLELNGVELTGLVFHNVPLTRPTTLLLRQAFHVPIFRTDDSRPHVGLFAIGESLRHLGGGAFMTLGQDWSVETILYFPTFS